MHHHWSLRLGACKSPPRPFNVLDELCEQSFGQPTEAHPYATDLETVTARLVLANASVPQPNRRDPVENSSIQRAIHLLQQAAFMLNWRMENMYSDTGVRYPRLRIHCFEVSLSLKRNNQSLLGNSP